MHSVRLQRGLKLTLFASISNGASTVNNVFPSNSSRVTLNLARLKQSTKYCLTSSFSHFSEKQTRYSPAAILPPRCHVFQCHVTSTHPLPTQIKDGKMARFGPGNPRSVQQRRFHLSPLLNSLFFLFLLYGSSVKPLISKFVPERPVRFFDCKIIELTTFVLACVQTSPLPQKKSFFLGEGGRLYTGYFCFCPSKFAFGSMFPQMIVLFFL